MKVLIPLLLTLIAAEVVAALCGLASNRTSGDAMSPARAALISFKGSGTRSTAPGAAAAPAARVAPTAPVPGVTRPAPRARVSPAPLAAPHSMTATAMTTATPATAGWGCPSAISYLSSHSAPGYSFVCPGYAAGHQAMTCTDDSSTCPGSKVIVIADPCPAAYMNEAHNSWVESGLQTGRIDPFGSCA